MFLSSRRPLSGVTRPSLIPDSGLWANANFMRLWGAETVAQFGSHISLIAIPLIAALTLQATPFEMGLLAAMGGLPSLLFGFIAGAWVDRLPRQPILVASAIGRAITLLAIPVAAACDLLSIGLLMAVAIVVGLQTVVFNSAYVAFLPGLVERSDLADANGKLYGSASLAQVAGPAIAGSLVSLVAAPAVILLNSLAFLGSGLFLRRIRHTEQPVSSNEANRHLLSEVRQGVRALLGTPILRATTLSAATINLAGHMFLAVYVIYMSRELGLSPTSIGLVYAAGGVGAFVGSLISSRLTRRIGVGPTLVWSAVAQGAFGVLVPLAILVPGHALPLIVAAEFMQWLWLVVFFANALSLRQAITPNRLLGRVGASNQVITQGVAPIGYLLGGSLGSLVNVQASLIVGVLGMFVGAFWVVRSPVAGIGELPAEPADLTM